ncbi:uncharacterized mitochondrial protein AtMg00810-like [Malus domestica]|uniref:uncharacterized mitochondrial protein AtMg00810-like n=1 Tax=Malus domestica TaxID=3750 RepID=UPI0039750110
MDEEIKAIEKNMTWELTNLLAHKNLIGVKWVYKTKKNAYGSINMYKARLVAKGYKQKEGEDYTEVFAPKCLYEHTLYVKSTSQGSFMVVSLYVDDLIFTGNDLELLNGFKLFMMKEFEMTNLGKLHHFLGIEVSQSKKGIFISQESYAKEVLKKFRMENANPVVTPCITGLKISKYGEGRLIDSTKFRSLVVNLMHLTATRPNIMYAVSLVRRFMEKPHSNYWEAAIRILRYIKGTIDYGIFYEANVPVKLIGYTDNDLAGSIDDCKSTSGYVFSLGSGMISWSSRKQPIVALSTTETEYIAAYLAGCHTVWLLGILESLMHKQKGPTTLFCDNSSTVSVSKDRVLH